MIKLSAIVFTICLGMACSAIVQNPAAQPSPSPSTQPAASAPAATAGAAAPSATAPGATARPGDVDSVEHIIAAVYDVISGPAGPRDWDRFRSFYYPGARMIPSRRDDKGVVTARVSSPDEYATRSQDFFSREGFFENSVSNRVEVWDHIAHVWSTYESRHARGEKPFARGINSFQLFNDGSRWWILTVYWEGEDPTHPLPEKYLK
ncbi:MAG TPA: hypothetical protein VNZ47_00470 [Candidatus Dormibacteraeota bacterium]|jgi:hypothetical protein|nr:hypothetical protein [Candidatus Dormibacteraeota bacterium]